MDMGNGRWKMENLSLDGTVCIYFIQGKREDSIPIPRSSAVPLCLIPFKSEIIKLEQRRSVTATM